MDLVNWQSRLAVKYKPKGGGKEELISPIDSFQPSFSLGAEALHSVERTHIGVVYSPQQITFSLTVKAIGPVAAQLTKLALTGAPFDVVMIEADDSSGPQWSFKEVLLGDCIITSATPTAATISGAPAATFSGFSLSGSVAAGSDRTVIPEVAKV
ncbi:hypothetical protein ACFODL_05090 [Phenylobacterium terrae]|uniref:Phage tail protein n=1 Tax=Phenylobacterium terrae TaxID=2665495 RepID=A0ABW4MV46_9CAUL